MNKTYKDVIISFDQTAEYCNEIEHFKHKTAYEMIKKCLGILNSIIALLTLIIPMYVIALAIKCMSIGTKLYIQDRQGKEGKIFKIIGFRLMINEAKKNRIQWCEKKNLRVTRLGAYIDTLLQLCNTFLTVISGRYRAICM